VKATELENGKLYRISWCEAVPGKGSFLQPNFTTGVGKLRRKSYPRSGWHQFTLKGSRKVVYANSRSITAIDGDHSIFAAEPKVIDKSEISDEVSRLRLLGADDDSRREEVESIATFLSGLGVESKADAEYTQLVIPYLGLANFKAVVARLYQRALLADIER
jgi:hypothetical protein